MSLILEALKKSQTTEPPLAAHTTPPQPSGKTTWPLALIVLAAMGIFVFKSMASRPLHQTSSESRTKNAPASAPQKMEGLQLLQGAQNQWRLNGVVNGGAGKAVALINGEIVEEGGTIRGAKVAKISENQVELEENGRTTTLNLQ